MNLRKKMLAVFSASVLAISFMGIQMSAAGWSAPQISTIKNSGIDGGSIQPRKDKIEWVYKTIDGHIYRRLYNYSKGEWVGDWIAC